MRKRKAKKPPSPFLSLLPPPSRRSLPVCVCTRTAPRTRRGSRTRPVHHLAHDPSHLAPLVINRRVTSPPWRRLAHVIKRSGVLIARARLAYKTTQQAKLGSSALPPQDTNIHASVGVVRTCSLACPGSNYKHRDQRRLQFTRKGFVGEKKRQAPPLLQSRPSSKLQLQVLIICF